MCRKCQHKILMPGSPLPDAGLEYPISAENPPAIGPTLDGLESSDSSSPSILSSEEIDELLRSMEEGDDEAPG